MHVKGYFASKRRGWRTSDTGELVFEEIRVPLGNLLGEENQSWWATTTGTPSSQSRLLGRRLLAAALEPREGSKIKGADHNDTYLV